MIDPEQDLTAMLALLKPQTADHLLLRLLMFVGDLELMARSLLRGGASPEAVIATIRQTADAFTPALTSELAAIEQD